MTFLGGQMNNPNMDYFKVYTLIWDTDKLTIMHQGTVIQSYTKPANSGWQQWPYDQLFFLYVELGIAWNGGPKPNPQDQSFFFEIDWLRILSRV
jgi:hypothetical protein